MELLIDDLKINYINKGVKDGKGENVLLIHGWGANIQLYQKIIDNLSNYCNVYALDLPGCGRSGEPKEVLTLDNYVNLIIKFIEKLNIDNITLIGHSHGGRIIIKLLNREDLHFKTNKIILLGSAGIVHKKSFSKIVRLKIVKLGKRILESKIVSKLAPNLLDNLRNKIGSEDYKMASPVMKKTLINIVNEDLSSFLPKIKNETLLIWGDKDTQTPIEDGRLMNKLIENSGIVEIKNASHYAFLEQPDYINRVIDAFLK